MDSVVYMDCWRDEGCKLFNLSAGSGSNVSIYCGEESSCEYMTVFGDDIDYFDIVGDYSGGRNTTRSGVHAANLWLRNANNVHVDMTSDSGASMYESVIHVDNAIYVDLEFNSSSACADCIVYADNADTIDVSCSADNACGYMEWHIDSVRQFNMQCDDASACQYAKYFGENILDTTLQC